MRPLTLTIEGLRSFRAPVRIDFADRDHIAIVGDTGAGKSSLLEAMTWALYGQTTFTGQGGRELMNDASTHMRVVFRFRVGGETWEAVRSARRRKGVVGSPIAELVQRDDDGEPLEQVEQGRRVNQRVEQLLGLDCNAFLRTVILPQGRFARLLVEDDPAARSKILRQVWRTDELEAVGRQAEEAWRIVRERRIGLEEWARTWPENPEARLKELRTRLEEATQAVSVAGRDETEAKEAGEGLRTAEANAARAAGVRQRLGSMDLPAVRRRLAPLSGRAGEFAGRERDLDARHEELKAARERLPSGDGPTSEEVAAAFQMLMVVEKGITAAVRDADAWRSSVLRASEKRAEAEQCGQRDVRARAVKAEHDSRRPPLEEALRQAERRRDDVARCHDEAARIAAELRKIRQKRDHIASTEPDSAAKLAEARERESRARREADEADERLAEMRRSKSAAHAAGGLRSGDSCPVCQRDLPDGWEAPQAPGFAEAERRQSEATRAAGEAARQATMRDAELQGVRKQVLEANDAVAEVEVRFENARRTFAGVAALEPETSLPERDAVLVPLEAERERAEGALARYDQAARRLADEAAARDKEHGISRRDAEHAEGQTEHARRLAEGTFVELRDALGRVPEPLRPELNLPAGVADLLEVDPGPVASAREMAEARDAVLKERQREEHRLTQEIEATERSRRRLDQLRKDELDTPLRELAQRLDTHRDDLVASGRDLDLEREIPHREGNDAAALEIQARDLDAARSEIADAAATLAGEAAAGAEAARGRFRALGERMGVAAGGHEALGRAAAERAEAARHGERTARIDAERFAAVACGVRRLRILLEQVIEKERALDDLRVAFRPGGFLKWLTFRRSQELLRYATKKLREISRDRYAFVDPEDVEMKWLILDNDSGQPRSPASLSGGEQFLASLSLALGMVEMMERTGGRLESLFLDEGFGSLDAGNLDAAIDALESAAATRMVAVISHVRAVAERIDHILSVTREDTGSRAEWLPPGPLDDPALNRLLD